MLLQRVDKPLPRAITLQPPPPHHPTPAPNSPRGFDQFARRVMSGEQNGVAASVLRAGMSAAEPFYAAVATARNRLFDAGLRKSHRLPRPVVSVGNITTGGTGKTPVVRWLAGRLRDHGHRVAVLARGYGARPGHAGDEQVMLDRLLNDGMPELQRVAVLANPDRVAAATQFLREHPETDAFVLDDGFQHRRLARDLDVVLVSATGPFGYGHVLPRGMLREPLRGLGRAGAVVITHADQAPAGELEAIEREVRRFNPHAPVYRAVHAHAGLRRGADHESRPIEDLRAMNWFALCGIGDPRTFLRQLQSIGGRYAGHRWFADHHGYTDADLAAVRAEARAAGADVLITTEKDWAKLKDLPGSGDADLTLSRVDVRVRFHDDGEARLWEQVRAVVDRPAGPVT